jgi:hypothetical protein
MADLVKAKERRPLSYLALSYLAFSSPLPLDF